mgnify:CR=1 FL=1
MKTVDSLNLLVPLVMILLSILPIVTLWSIAPPIALIIAIPLVYLDIGFLIAHSIFIADTPTDVEDQLLRTYTFSILSWPLIVLLMYEMWTLNKATNQ